MKNPEESARWVRRWLSQSKKEQMKKQTRNRLNRFPTRGANEYGLVVSLATESWREYDFGGRVYRIENPKTLFMRHGGTTHRVEDSAGIVHCIPAPGYLGCALRWKNKNSKVPCEF